MLAFWEGCEDARVKFWRENTEIGQRTSVGRGWDPCVMTMKIELDGYTTFS